MVKGSTIRLVSRLSRGVLFHNRRKIIIASYAHMDRLSIDNWSQRSNIILRKQTRRSNYDKCNESESCVLFTASLMFTNVLSINLKTIPAQLANKLNEQLIKVSVSLL